MSKFQLLTRQAFQQAVFERDNHKCIFCGKTAEQTPEGKLDAHHIMERRLWPDGGYYPENGATVCEEHHLECEMTIHSLEVIREKAGITKIIVPPHLYDDHIFDKWGNPILEDGRRGKGELFFDESVQKVLNKGGMLPLFTNYVKYSRTPHLAWSPGVHDDDRVLHSLDAFMGKTVVITKKMDGENTSMYNDHIHARSIDSKGGADRAWVKNFWSTFAYDIPEGWRICGENLWAEHSIHYEQLKSYFHGFSIWNERNICLSWEETLEYFAIFGIHNVHVLKYGVCPDNYDDAKKWIRSVEKELDLKKDEGYVIRVAGAFSYADFKTHVAKFVRAGHVQTAKHWRQGRQFIPNELEKK